MRIEGQRADLLKPTLDHVDGPTAPVGNQASPVSPPATTDQVRLSDGAQLMQAAMQAARQAPDIRLDVVERMRAALDRGEIGNDPERIADALLDHWTSKKSQDR